MARGKKIGVVLILTGFCIPILAILFASQYNPRYGFIRYVQSAEIVLWKRIIPPFNPYMHVDDKNQNTIKGDIFDEIIKEEEIAYVLPYRYCFGLGIILTTIGIGLFLISENVRGKAPME